MAAFKASTFKSVMLMARILGNFECERFESYLQRGLGILYNLYGTFYIFFGAGILDSDSLA